MKRPTLSDKLALIAMTEKVVRKNPTSGREGLVEELFKAGAHFGFIKSRRHPSVLPYIFGEKDKIEIFNLERTSEELEKALDFIESKGKENASIIFVGGKSEAREAIRSTASELEMPYVAGRWIGGTLTNFGEIKKRLARLDELTGQRERGELAKWTKKERLLIDREIDKLEIFFGGLTSMKALPKMLVVIDPKKEHIAVDEALKIGIPVMALAGSDSNLHELDYPIPGNDASKHSIAFVLNKIKEAYIKGRKEGKEEKTEEK
ncbi:MAG: 30S ribosomal protein S2 [bacterium]|nr:30S ribosomal protein S2 [bacterium]